MISVNILGQVWDIDERTTMEDDDLKDCDGYCKPDLRLIVIDSDPDITDKEKYKKQVLRHEILHAFLFESGLGYNMNVAKSGHDEQMIDWVAMQYPKIKNVYKELYCED